MSLALENSITRLLDRRVMSPALMEGLELGVIDFPARSYFRTLQRCWLMV